MKRSGIGTGEKSIARGSTFKVPRAAMRRKRRRIPTHEQAARRTFFAVGAGQPCAVCGKAWRSSSTTHHVIYEQFCPPGFEWDVRNAMPICRSCHDSHHGAIRKIPRGRLSVAHWQFARQLGLEWRLERHYPKAAA